MLWHLWYDETPRAGWENMAIDQALLDLAAATANADGKGFLRIYRWEPFCLSFGRHEPAARRYDRARITALGLDAVRRPTGGRGVWHARELTYAVAAPSAWFGSLPTAYARIHRMLAGAVRCLGAEATLASAPGERSAPLEAGACFAQPAGGEVMVNGRKVVGSAQLREGGAFLQHGSMLLSDDQQLLTQLLPGARPGLDAPLTRLLGREVSFREAAEAVATAAAAWPGEWRDGSPAGVLDRARAHADRFRSPEWTWRR